MLLEDIVKHIKIYSLITSEDKSIQKIVFSNTAIPGKFETCSFLRDNKAICDICFSVMAGCNMKCQICATTYSSIPYGRNLNAEEMIAQIYIAIQKRITDLAESSKITITFMGNGEPFSNLNNVIETIKGIDKIVNQPIRGYNISTIGLNLHGLKDLSMLAVNSNKKIKIQYSLLSLSTNIRKRLIPNGLPVSLVTPSLDDYAKTTNIPVKYNVPLICGINDSKKHLDFLIKFILEKPKLRVLKLSRYNSFPGSPFIGCSDDEIYLSAKYAEKQGVKPKVFFGDKNDKIFATCGLMRLVHDKKESYNTIEE